jgi:hypothetical protein
MTSVGSGFSKVATNALYVNIASVTTSIFNEDGTVAGWANAAPAATPLASAGQVFRDMGKTVYLPAPTTPNAVAMQSTILRKVQWIPQNSTADFYGTGGGDANGFFTGYISLGGQTYAGGGSGATIKFARAN